MNALMVTQEEIIDHANKAIEMAKGENPKLFDGCGNARAVDCELIIPLNGETRMRVIIEEAAPDATAFVTYIEKAIHTLAGYRVEVRTEW